MQEKNTIEDEDGIIEEKGVESYHANNRSTNAEMSCNIGEVGSDSPVSLASLLTALGRMQPSG